MFPAFYVLFIDKIDCIHWGLSLHKYFKIRNSLSCNFNSRIFFSFFTQQCRWQLKKKTYQECFDVIGASHQLVHTHSLSHPGMCAPGSSCCSLRTGGIPARQDLDTVNSHSGRGSVTVDKFELYYLHGKHSSKQRNMTFEEQGFRQQSVSSSFECPPVGHPAIINTCGNWDKKIFRHANDF